MATNDTWLHTGGVAPSNVPSRIASPEVPGMDAGSDVRVGSGTNLESQGVGSQTPLTAPNIPFLDNIGSHLGGVDMPIVTPTPTSAGAFPPNDTNAFNASALGNGNGIGGNGGFGFCPPPTLDQDTRRWMNLDHGFNFGFDSQIHGNANGDGNENMFGGQEDTLFGEIDQTAFNDFSRFLEQAGTSNSETELFPW